MKILVVDDEPISALFLGSALEAEGYDVRMVMNADDALSTGNSFRPDCLITDWMLKDDRDGIEVASSLLEEIPELKIIFITGMAKDMLRAQAGNLKYEAIVVKPVEIDTVLALLKN